MLMTNAYTTDLRWTCKGVYEYSAKLNLNPSWIRNVYIERFYSRKTTIGIVSYTCLYCKLGLSHNLQLILKIFRNILLLV